MDFLHRLLDRLDLLIAGLFGVIVASWWHKDDLTDWRAWMIFLITGVSCSLYLTGAVTIRSLHPNEDPKFGYGSTIAFRLLAMRYRN